ncbi:MAG: PAS domain S-box protein, partial [Cyclobacteriaceae bacterium]
MENDEHYLKQELFHLLNKDESIFEFLQEGSLDGLWYWDLEHPENEWMNAKFWTTLGYDPSTKSHHANQWQDIIFSEDLAVAKDNLSKHCNNPDHPYDQVVRYKHADNSTVWIRCRGIAIRDEKGKPIRMLGAHTNITKEKEQEIELKKLLKKYESILNSQSAFVLRYSKDGVINYVNKYLLNLFEVSENTVIGAHLSAFFNIDEIEKLLNPTTCSSGSNYKVIVPYCTEEEIKQIAWEICIISDPENNEIEYQGLGFDVTEKLNAEQKIKLQASLLDTIGQAVIATDHKGIIIYWNSAATRIYGWQADEVMGRLINEITPATITKEKKKNSLNLALKNESWSGEFIVKRKNGTNFYAWVSNTPFLNDNGEVIGIIRVSMDISAEKELQSLQEKLALVAAKTNDAVVITDAEGYTTWINDSFTKVTGYSLEEMRGKKPGEVLQGPKTDQVVKNRISKCIENKQSCQEVILNYSKDGKKYWMDLTIDPVFDQNGNLKQFIAIQKDVTEQIRENERYIKKNQELKWTKELLEQTNQVAQIGGWDLNLETQNISWTSVTREIFEVDESFEPDLESIGKFFKVESERTMVKNTMRDLISNGPPFDVTYQIITAKGNHRWVRSIGKREVRNGTCVRIFGINQNIDEQKKANQRFENIRNAINQHTLVSITDLNGVIIDVNDIFCETTQYRREEIIGKTHKLINSGYHNDDFFAKMWHVLQTGKVWKGEISNRRKDGSICWMLSTIVPFFDLNGQPEQYVCISTDITSQKLAEEDKQKSVELISEQRNKLLDFSYIVSHNIRSHASNILGIADLLQKINTVTEKKELVEVLHKAAFNLDETLHYLNDLLKVQSNFQYKKRTVIVKNVVENVINSMKHKIVEVDARIHIDIENNLYTKINPTYLNNILQNLIDNALRYRHPNRQPEINVMANRKNG